ncbi:MAG: hypothetical protein CVU00_15270 [Bacteroidetes bacterium HGW-Bacteroidetes-17]|jgi:hypothetical protein|nr:MAG: hypothetical protein CVU00_15270 [Bacteroidetes bacterium HGW-Bacteroidetes-17]
MKVFSYKLDHDYGLAPNPFGEYCTLAVCKSGIRSNKNLNIGDWITGTGSAKLNNLNHLVYAMKVEEKITFQEYWEDSRFQYKKPKLNGSLVQLYGDNIYHQDKKSNSWIQENAAHSLDGGHTNQLHLDSDVGGKFVLISKEFYYFGDQHFLIPKRYWEICSQGRNMMWRKIPEKVRTNFIQWLTQKYSIGIHGDPINWKEHLK